MLAIRGFLFIMIDITARCYVVSGCSSLHKTIVLNKNRIRKKNMDTRILCTVRVRSDESERKISNFVRNHLQKRRKCDIL